jgi:hypothetical protein
MVKTPWDPEFTPSYTPKEMLELGVFEGKYINALSGLPPAWYKLPKVLGPKDEPDATIDHFGVKSRQPLSEWKKKGWTTDLSPYGWFQWYCLYWTGRRNDKEDTLQIGRWKSFIARHQGQVDAKCTPKDRTCNTRQRQGLLQWAWDSATSFTEAQRKANLSRLKKRPEVTLEDRRSHSYLNW